MNCRHVWSVADEYAMVATCLHRPEIRPLQELIEAGLKSAEEGKGPSATEVKADFARLRAHRRDVE